MQLPNLPITPSLSAIDEALAAGHLVLDAPPGSGKTTLVPLSLRQSGWLGGRSILMLEPRRPAARMAAHRMASLLGEQVGEQVGYQVRFERRIGASTRIEVLTEGLLLRRLQQDPELPGVGLVIFDEFHERGLSGDLSLTLCRDVVSGLREDLRLMAMSASLDGAALAHQLGARHLQAKGRSYPVHIGYLERDPPREERNRQLARLVREALNSHAGDVLVFLPGKPEIRSLEQLLAKSMPPRVTIEQLHAEVPPGQQDRIIRGKAPGRRVILSTDIAETSLTIAGIGVVIDSGLNRRPHFDPSTGLTRLQTGFIPQASALQRAGRAGRLGPGHCYRAWSAARQERLAPEIRPEILDADLAETVLELAGWGVQDPDQLNWVTPPPNQHWQQARQLLEQLGALDGKGLITVTGRAMLRLPVHPRLAHLLVATGTRQDRRLSADIAALLSERDPVARNHAEASGCDLRARLAALAETRAGLVPEGFQLRALRRIEQVSQQLQAMSEDRQPSAPSSPLSAGLALALAFPDRIAMARAPGSTDYLLSNGRAASLPPHDPLCGSDLLVAAALDAGRTQGRIWLAAPLQRAELEAHFADRITEQRELEWDREAGAVRAWRRRRLDALVLDSHIEPIGPEDDTQAILLQQLRSQGIDLFKQAPALRQLQAKTATLRRYLDEREWPDLCDQALLTQAEEWLGPWLSGIHSIRRLREIDIPGALQAWLGWDLLQRLEKLLPGKYRTAAGTERAIEYAQDADPVLRVPLQEMLGSAQGPSLADGRVPVVLHLLSPAMRPLQITRDLGHFWGNAYAEVRKEMRGRYPKHHWPQDPLNAAATRLGRRGRSSQG